MIDGPMKDDVSKGAGPGAQVAEQDDRFVGKLCARVSSPCQSSSTHKRCHLSRFLLLPYCSPLEMTPVPCNSMRLQCSPAESVIKRSPGVPMWL